jgi:N-acetylglucosamine kinase
MCLSGAGTKFVHDSMSDSFAELGAKYKVYIANDTLGPIFSAFENGGLVVISGTGSKCVLVNPIGDLAAIKSFDDISCFSSGGWGNLLGDEGSGLCLFKSTNKCAL